MRRRRRDARAEDATPPDLPGDGTAPAASPGEGRHGIDARLLIEMVGSAGLPQAGTRATPSCPRPPGRPDGIDALEVIATVSCRPAAVSTRRSRRRGRDIDELLDDLAGIGEI
ncbi:MAG: hypothetical protein ACRD12_03375 [Acidimicrobiales bacterium]